MEALATSRGWQPTTVHHALTIDKATVDEWPGTSDQLRLATKEDLEDIRPLHDTEFPDTHTPVERLLDKLTVIVGIEGNRIVGYIAGQVHPDGEGYIDYLAVDSSQRRQGLGRQLVMALTRGLMDVAPLGVVALTVDDERAAARNLYASLGFATATSFVAYHS